MNGQIHLFQWLYQHFSVGLLASVQTLEGRMIAAEKGPITAMLSAWVIAQSFQFYKGWIAGDVIIKRFMTLFIVLWLIGSPAIYSQIQILFLQTLPDFISSAVGGGAATSLPQQFDIMNNEYTAAALIIYKQSRGIIGPVILNMELNGLEVVFAMALILIFFVYWLSVTIMAVLIIIGPLMLPFFNFEKTKEIGDRWLAKLVGLSVTQLIIAVLLAMFMAGTLAFINSEFSGSFSNLSSQQELIVMIDCLAFIVSLTFAAAGAWMMGAYIGGGVAFNISSLVNPRRWRTI